jgi:ABC-2 type transport system permease protein
MGLKKYGRIYWKYFKQFWKSRLIYKTDFVLGIIAHSISVIFSIAFLSLLFTQVEHLNGWTFEQMLFLAATGGIIMNVHHIFLFNIYRLGEQYIVKGDLDRVLLRPLNPLFQIYAGEVRDNSVAKLLVNLAIMGYALANISIGMFTPLKIVYGLLVLISGVMIFASTYLVFASTAFWTGRSQAAIWLIFRISDFRKYPFSIYGAPIQVLLVTFIPLAFASFFPATFFLEKTGWELWQLASIIAGPVFYFFAHKFWRFGLSNYSSTGS